MDWEKRETDMRDSMPVERSCISCDFSDRGGGADGKDADKKRRA